MNHILHHFLYDLLFPAFLYKALFLFFPSSSLPQDHVKQPRFNPLPILPIPSSSHTPNAETMCHIWTTTYTLCSHKGPTTCATRCPAYIDSGYEITCDDPLKRAVHPRFLEGWCLGCRPIVHEKMDSKEEDFVMGKEDEDEDDDDEMEWRLLKVREEIDEEERRAVSVRAEFGKMDKGATREGM
ncbi:MAG: hypothetical protein Q9171_004232 [Xanthocarpia ochracea]